MLYEVAMSAMRKKMKQIKDIESHKSTVLDQTARKGHSEVVTFEQSPEWRKEGSHGDGYLEKVLSRWTEPVQKQYGIVVKKLVSRVWLARFKSWLCHLYLRMK